MVSSVSRPLPVSSLLCLPASPKLPSFKTLSKQARAVLLGSPSSLIRFGGTRLYRFSKRERSICFFNAGKESEGNVNEKESELDWPILKRWDAPWQWQTASLTSLACAFSFVLTGLVEAAALPYLGINIEELSLDEKAGILFLDQSITTAVVLGVIYNITNTFQPLPEDVFRYDLREPFNLQKGWLLWAGIGLFGAILGIALAGFTMSALNGETPQREVGNLFKLGLFFFCFLYTIEN